MKNLIFLSLLSLFTLSCKPVNTLENLPKPLPERPKNNPENNDLTPEETKEMEILKTEIMTLANSEKCINSSDWKTIGLGVKACGGPVSYIAYSINIDTKTLMEKVELYNQKSIEYNKKYSLVSDCMLIIQPENIVCENGESVFK